MRKYKKLNIWVFTFSIIMLSIINYQCVNTPKKANTEKKQQTDAKRGYPKLSFTKEIHKFGQISEGEIAVCEFYFKNIGTSNLIISNIETSCGCTNVIWEKKPIAPGKESKISIEFDSHGRYGKQYKVVTLFCNTLKKTKELVITADVK